MDRLIQKKRSFKRMYFTSAFFIIFFMLGFWILSDSSSLKIEKDSVEIKAVQKGAFNVYVIGNGEVIPRDVDYIMSKVDGELSAVNVQSGNTVKKGQTLFVIKNEELMVEFDNSKIAVAEAEAALEAKKFELETHKLQLEMSVLKAKSNYLSQSVEYLAYKNLLKKPNPPISLILFQQAEIRESQMKKIYELELIKLKKFSDSMDKQLIQYKSRINLAENIFVRAKTKVEDLNLKSKTTGIIQDVNLKPGQRVEIGTVVGLVSNPSQVYIRLKVSAVQGHRLKFGQTAIISLRNEEKKGKVVRIDPNVKGTTIDVDVEFDDGIELPISMFVSGKIIIEELADALFVEAPLAGAIENGTSSFYQVSKDGSHAQLVKVATGMLSGGKVQIRGVLQAGDKIVVSDTGKFNGVKSVAIH